METSVNLVEICVKPEPMECENPEENEHNGYSQQTKECKEEEIWIKPEPFEDESQDSIKDEDQGTLSENEARLDEEALNDECNRNRQSNAPSRKQILVFLDFLNEHRDLANCLLRGPTGRAKAHQLWEDIANTLNSISGCTKTDKQWQRVWSDKKYLARKAVATRLASLATGGPPAPELTRQDEKILAIIGEPIPPRRASKKPATPEPKPQASKPPQEIFVSVTQSLKRGPVKVEVEAPPAAITELVEIPPEVPRQANIPRKPYTPRKPDALRKTEVSRKSDASRKSEVPRKADVPQQPEVPPPTVAPPDVSQQPDVPQPSDDPQKPVVHKNDDPPKPVGQKQDDLPPSPSISDPPSPNQQSQPELNRQGRLRLRACLDPYTKKFIHLEEERIKNDKRRNTELSEIKTSLQQGTAELAGIRQVMQEMLGLMRQLAERDDNK